MTPDLCPACCIRSRDPGRLVCGPCAADQDYRVLNAPGPELPVDDIEIVPDEPTVVTDPAIVPAGARVADGTPDPFADVPPLLAAAKAVLRAWFRSPARLTSTDHGAYIDLAAAIDAEEARRGN